MTEPLPPSSPALAPSAATESAAAESPRSGIPPAPWRRERLPEWLRLPLDRSAASRRVSAILRDRKLHTICEEARCPNRNHCYSRGTATFLSLGDRCTRSCPFCSVAGGPPLPPDAEEPARLIDAVVALGLRHVVITSVNRDDLPDQGSGHFVACIAGLRERLPELTIEVLIPDFRGRAAEIDRVLAARPDILNHNLETVPRLDRTVRPGARYERSLDLLERARSRGGMWVKSGVMVGLGESPEELDRTMLDLHERGCQILTVGQYLAPTPESLPVVEYVPPARFAEIEGRGREIGFDHVFAGPFVRSSYLADTQVPLR